MIEIKSRTKQPISILRELRTKYSRKVTDLVGAKILVTDRKKVDKISKVIKKKFKVIKDKDLYKKPLGGYRARHLIVKYRKYPVEIQVKTKGIDKIGEKYHQIYKTGTKKQKNRIKKLFDNQYKRDEKIMKKRNRRRK